MFYYDVETYDAMVLVKADSPMDAIELACEKLTRLDRDGEFFLRLFDDNDDGILRCRFVEPLQIANPTGKDEAHGAWFGIQFDDTNYEKPIRYYVQPMNFNGSQISPEQMEAWEEGVDADHMQHRTANVNNVVRSMS